MTKITAAMALEQAEALDDKVTGDISHLPGQNGLPIIGDAFPFIADPIGYTRKCMAKYGPVFRTRLGPDFVVNLIDPEAQKMLTLDPDQLFSTRKGYGTTLGIFFPDGLLMRDFSDHRMHRRIMQSSFKNSMLEAYMPEIHQVVRKHVARWADSGNIHFVHAIKAALLEVGSSVFLGIKLGKDSGKLNQAFINMAQATGAALRFNIPGTAYSRGLKSYKVMSDYFRKEIPKKRESESTDMFSLFCKETKEDGSYFSDDDIVHHVNFLLFAAHDTTTSTLSTLMYELTQKPEWVQVCRDELLALDQDTLRYKDLDNLENTTYCFKETLRLYPPVVGLARRSLRDFDFLGHKIPANSMVSVPLAVSHRLKSIYKDPDSFDPLRFAPGREEHKVHPFAWFPFGGGAHKCIGLHFAEMLVKVALFEMLQHYRFESIEPHGKMSLMPFPKPINNLPLKVSRRNKS
jgi:cytochrome P450